MKTVNRPLMRLWTPLKGLNETLAGPKESYSRVNDSKQQLNSFIIYDLDSIARVNERKKKKKKSEINKKKKSGAAGTRTHGRGSVPLVSKLDAIPLRHEAETIFAAQIFL